MSDWKHELGQEYLALLEGGELGREKYRAGKIAKAEELARMAARAAPAQSPTAPAVKRTKRKTWRDVAFDYVVGVYNAGQYSTAKDLFKALQSKAGAESPFDVGTGDNRGELFVREIGKVLNSKTLENAMPEIKAAKNDLI